MRLRAYLELLRPHARALTVAAVLLAIGGVLPGASVWLLQHGLRRLHDPLGLTAIAAASVGVVALYTLTQIGRAALTRRVAGQIASTLRLRVLDAWWRREEGVGDGLSAILDEVDQVQYGVSALVTAFRNPIALVALIGSAFVLAPGLAALALVVFSAVAAAGTWASRQIKGATGEARRARAALAALLAEQLANADVIRAYEAGPDESRRFRARDDADRVARLALELRRVGPAALVELAGALAVGLVMVVGSFRVADGAIDGPTLLALVAALLLANRPLAGLTEVQTLLARSLAALERIDRLLTGLPTEAPPADLPAPGPLVWDGVGVALGGRPIVLEVGLRADPGELVALVGPSGAGKTTILRAAWGAVPLATGSVTLGGVPVPRVAVAFVPQEIQLFARTIAENVALGGVPDRERVARALALAGAGFADPDHVLADRGAGLSGGERQRLCLARALYRDAPVLLLDEPTAQLDPATAARIAETLRTLRTGRAIVVATHDPEVWTRADRIVEIEAGRIVDARWTAAHRS